MAATAKKISITVNATGAAAIPVDLDDRLGGNLGNDDPGYQNVILSNLHATNVVAVSWNGVTAAINGDDVRHILPLSYILIPYPNKGLLSLRGSADTFVEIAGA